MANPPPPSQQQPSPLQDTTVATINKALSDKVQLTKIRKWRRWRRRKWTIQKSREKSIHQMERMESEQLKDGTTPIITDEDMASINTQA